MLKGKRILCFSDFSLVGTGFGTVSRYVLSTFHQAGLEINHLAINYHGDFVDRNIVPWQQQPARLLDPKDPHGTGMFLRTVATRDYDYIWVCNDLYVLNGIAKQYQQVVDELIAHGKKAPILIYYYPVDCRVKKSHAGFLDVVDVPVCYNQYGYDETLKTFPHLKDRLQILPHGTDTTMFHPLSEKERKEIRRDLLGIGDETTVVIQVNRNNTRKQIPYSFLAFKKFREQVPDSIYYCHMAVIDQGGDLRDPLEHLGLTLKNDVVFPVNYSSSHPVAPEILNNIYNAGDMFLSCHLGEGHGLTAHEAMAAGLPVILPNNTNTSELLGNNERGYIYPCRDEIYIDSSGFRKRGLIPDVVEAMMKVKNAIPEEKEEVTSKARQWTEEHDWKLIAPRWLGVLREATFSKKQKRSSVQEI